MLGAVGGGQYHVVHGKNGGINESQGALRTLAIHSPALVYGVVIWETGINRLKWPDTDDHLEPVHQTRSIPKPVAPLRYSAWGYRTGDVCMKGLARNLRPTGYLIRHCSEFSNTATRRGEAALQLSVVS